MQDNINIGYIAGFHGIKGEVKIKSTTDFKEERFKKGNILLLVGPRETVEMKIDSVREHKGMVLVKFTGIFNINDVEKYKGYEVKVNKENRMELAEDEFYFFDLVGLDVLNYNKENIGKVIRVMDTGASQILIIKHNEDEVMIPFVKAIVTDVDMAKNEIYLSDIEGLY
ncbi:ribosome maturation factor RimM [Mycoplasma sp. P36-A1]|uniref:ribosome maturation factor RimM n=1 Tax=Mycoplasma sp. P36-A1 TaxID=3252900 RepID=UPI003C2C9C17